MASTPQWDDDYLLAQLASALAPPDVPATVLDAAKAVYTWRTVDSELAELTYDSAHGEALVGVRGCTAWLRTLVYEAGQLALEIDITKDALVGHVLPPISGRLLILGPHGDDRHVPVDHAGRFRVHPVPRRPFRLSFAGDDGSRLTTGEVPS
ncbi:MAG TPA: hypothetical protein VES02_08165 [Dermatophilaceae bacterium]|nr:hypothetical protein [Dermatophilaceae bacterium]